MRSPIVVLITCSSIIAFIVTITLVSMVCGILWWNRITCPSIEFMKSKGFKFDKRDKLSLYSVWKEIYVDHEYDQALRDLPPEPVIVDVGANIGLFAARCTELCKNPTVYCYEPVPEIFSLLHYNAGKMGGNIKPYPVGVGDRNYSTTIQYFPRASAMSTGCDDTDDKFEVGIVHQVNNYTTSPILAPILRALFRLYINAKLQPEKVQIRIESFTKILSNIKGEIDLVKIDCECCELSAVKALSAEDLARINTVFIEVENYRTNWRQEITEIFEKNNFKVRIENESKPWCDIIANRIKVD